MSKTNLLVVSLDTLRADVGYSAKLPNLERLREKSTTFRTVVSSVPLTPPSHASIFTGLQPSRHGIRHLLREQLPSNLPTLASILAHAGYSTGAVVSCPGLNEWYGLGQGFQHYDDDIPCLPDGRDALHLADVKLRGLALKRAPLVVERALEWLASKPSAPIFLFAHFFDTHWPYEPPHDYGIAVSNPYEGEAAYADYHLGRLFDGLENAGYDLDDMLTVVFSDHGEDLAGWYPNDHAGPEGHHPEEEGHGCLLYDATQLVPFVIHWPGHAPVVEIPYQVRLIDVLPTILELLSLPAPAGIDGASLAPFLFGTETSHRLAYSETFFREELAATNPRFGSLKALRSLRIEDCYKVLWENGNKWPTVIDLVRDPNELRSERLDLESPLGRQLRAEARLLMEHA